MDSGLYLIIDSQSWLQGLMTQFVPLIMWGWVAPVIMGLLSAAQIVVGAMQKNEKPDASPMNKAVENAQARKQEQQSLLQSRLLALRNLNAQQVKDMMAVRTAQAAALPPSQRQAALQAAANDAMRAENNAYQQETQLAFQGQNVINQLGSQADAALLNKYQTELGQYNQMEAAKGALIGAGIQTAGNALGGYMQAEAMKGMYGNLFGTATAKTPGVTTPAVTTPSVNIAPTFDTSSTNWQNPAQLNPGITIPILPKNTLFNLKNSIFGKIG